MRLNYKSADGLYYGYITLDKNGINPTYQAPIRVHESTVFQSAVNMQDRIYAPYMIVFDSAYNSLSSLMFKASGKNLLVAQVSTNNKDDGFMVQSNSGTPLLGIQAGYTYPIFLQA